MKSALKPFFVLLLVGLTACAGKDAVPEQPTFTQTRPRFTLDRSDSSASTIHFTDITQAAGIDFVHETGAFGQKWMPETLGSGGGFLDYDNDGWPDIFLVNSTEWPGHESGRPKPTPKLYRNRGDGTFSSEGESRQLGTGKALGVDPATLTQWQLHSYVIGVCSALAPLAAERGLRKPKVGFITIPDSLQVPELQTL